MHLRLLPPPVVPLLGGLLLSTPAMAGDPDPGASFVGHCIPACPAGDIEFTVVTRERNGEPWSGGAVAIEFCLCPGFRLAGSLNPPYRVSPSGCSIAREPNALGLSRFPIAGGGVCGGAGARVTAGGIDFGNRPMVSPDQDGDWRVTEDDLVRLAEKLGLTDPTGDLDCDGVVSQADLELARSHLGHRGDLITMATGSWGLLKIIYR